MRSTVFLAAALAISIASAASAAAMPPASPGIPDVSRWQGFLSRYVDTATTDGIHRVRYAAVTPADKAALADYLKALQAAPISTYPQEEQRALWINMYNARTVLVVLDHYPLKSVRDIRLPGSLEPGPWDAKLLRVEGKDLSLNDVENGILRALWKDNRIHFALNCASLGCPDLAARAFTAANTEALLEAGARGFIGSPRGVALSGGKLELSSIFAWYRADFGADEKAVLASIARYAPADLAGRLKTWSGKIEYGYDWNLNAAASAPVQGGARTHQVH